MTQLTMRVEDLILPAPLQFQDTRKESLASNDFAASSTGLPRLDRGFNVKGDSDGEYTVITLAVFRRKLFDKTSGVVIVDHKKISDAERNDLLQSIKADGNEETVYLKAGQWNMAPIIFVEKTGSPDSILDIGII